MIASEPSWWTLLKPLLLVGERCVNFKACQLKMVMDKQKPNNSTTWMRKVSTPRSSNIQLNPIVGCWHPVTLQHDMPFLDPRNATNRQRLGSLQLVLHSPSPQRHPYIQNTRNPRKHFALKCASFPPSRNTELTGAKEKLDTSDVATQASHRLRPQACCLESISYELDNWTAWHWKVSLEGGARCNKLVLAAESWISGCFAKWW